MQQATGNTEDGQYEMASIDGPCSAKEAGFDMQPPGSKSEADIRHVENDYQGGAYEVIANTENALQKEETNLSGRGPETDESLAAITLATQQQIILFRQKMFLMALFLVMFFLIAVASLVLSLTPMISGQSFSSIQPTSSPGLSVRPLSCGRSSLRICGDCVREIVALLLHY